MSKDENIYTALTGYPGLTDLISTRVYPLVMPQTEDDGGSLVPAVVYQMVAEQRFKTLLDGMGAPARSLYQFTAWDRSAKAADEVRFQVEAALAAAAFTSVVDSLLDIYDDSTALVGAVVSVWIWDA